MTRWNRFLLPCLAVVAMSVAAACTGDGDDDVSTSPTPNPSPSPSLTPLPGSVAEVEPNETSAAATVVTTGSDANFHGTCASDTDSDFFRFTPDVTGNVTINVAWIEAGASGPDVDLYVYDNNNVELDFDDGVPPGDSPATVVANVTSAGQPHFIEVICYEAPSGVFYQGSIDQP